MHRWIPVGMLFGLLVAQACALETSGRGNTIPDGGYASASGDSGTDASGGYSSLSPLAYAPAEGSDGIAGAGGAGDGEW